MTLLGIVVMQSNKLFIMLGYVPVQESREAYTRKKNPLDV